MSYNSRGDKLLRATEEETERTSPLALVVVRLEFTPKNGCEVVVVRLFGAFDRIDKRLVEFCIDATFVVPGVREIR